MFFVILKHVRASVWCEDGQIQLSNYNKPFFEARVSAKFLGLIVLELMRKMKAWKNYRIGELCEVLNEINIKGQENEEEFERLHFSYRYGAINRYGNGRNYINKARKKRKDKKITEFGNQIKCERCKMMDPRRWHESSSHRTCFKGYHFRKHIIPSKYHCHCLDITEVANKRTIAIKCKFKVGRSNMKAYNNCYLKSTIIYQLC